MALAIAILVGALFSWRYAHRGLFLGSLTLVSVFLAVTGAMAYGAVMARNLNIDSPYTYAGTMAGLAVFLLIAFRFGLAFMDKEVDFHPTIERLGGALAGLLSGLFIMGFVCVCLQCMPAVKQLEVAQDSIRQTTALVLIPCRQLNRLIRGQQQFTLENLQLAGGQSSGYMPPPPPPMDASNSVAPSEDMRVSNPPRVRRSVPEETNENESDRTGHP